MTDIVYNKNGVPFDIDAIATDLNGKADVDLVNCTDAGNIVMAKASMPSDTYVDLTLGASGTDYTAPADGWVMFKKTAGASGQYFYIINISAYGGLYSMIPDVPQGYEVGGYVPVKKGDTFRILYNLSGTTNMFRFFYAQGSESEAS